MSGKRFRIVAAFASALMLSACAPSPTPDLLVPASPTSGLRMMTYNLLGAQADGNVYSEWAGWAARVRQLRPDILVVQEAQADDVGALYGLTGEYKVATYTTWECDVKGNPEGVAILVRNGLDVVGSGGGHVGGSCLDPSMRRVLVWVDLDLASGPLRVYGTHLTAGGGAAAASREAQMRAIRARIVADDPAGTRRWVLAGDINAAPGSFGFRLLLGDIASDAAPYRFVDSFAVDHPSASDPAVCPTVPNDPVSMAALLADQQHVRDCGYTSGWPKDDNLLGCDLLSLCTSWERRRDLSVRERIDYVLFAEGAPIEVRWTFVPNRSDPDWEAVGSEWFRLSDHLPYVVDLQIGSGDLPDQPAS